MKSSKGLPAVIAGVDIGRIRLVEANARTRVRSVHEVTEGANLLLSYGARLVDGPSDKGVFHVLARMDARVATDDKQDEPFVHVVVKFELRYRLREGVTATRAELSEFAKGNGVFNAWPYFREVIQTATGRMDLPPIVIPLYRFGTTKRELPSPARARLDRKKHELPT